VVFLEAYKMSDEIKVSVNSYGAGRALSLYWRDPITGKRKIVSAKTTNPKEAERAAAVLQAELNSGRYASPSKVTWADFRRRYETEKLSTLARKTGITAASAMNHLERVLDPDRLVKLTPAAMSQMQAELRKPHTVTIEKIIKGKRVTKTTVKPGMTDVTLACTLRHLRAALAWGVSVGLLPKVPDLHPPKKAKGQTLMRGRPITAEEFERMVAAVPKVRPQDSAAWVRYLTGLWLSGLRLEESLVLSWDQDEPFAVDLSGKRPAFRIYAEAQKARRDEILPMTPDFAQWLLKTPEAERHGQVFKMIGLENGKPIAPRTVGRLVSKIGNKAGVVVNKAADKCATAHDLRRAFGTRWASRVKPAVLQRLMRHANIATTMGYYVALDAGDVADDLWANFGATYNNSYNKQPEELQQTETAPIDESTEAIEMKEVT
jgi:integrase